MSASSEVVSTEAPPTPQDSYIHLPGTLNIENVYKFLDLAAKSDFYHDFHVPPKKKKEGEESKAEEDEEDDIGKEGTSVERYLKQLSQSYDPMYEKAPYNLTNTKYTTAITDLKSQLVTINNTMFQMFEDNIKLTLPSDGNPDILKQSSVSEEKVLAELFGTGNIQEKILNKLANTDIFIKKEINGQKDQINIKSDKLYGKYENTGPENEINSKYLTDTTEENLTIQGRKYNIRCFPVKIGSGNNYINLPDAFKHVSGNTKKKYVLMIDASILSFTTITQLYQKFMDSKKEEGVGVSEFYILSNMEGDSDPATKFAKVDKVPVGQENNGAKVFFLKEKNPEYHYPYKSVKLDSTSNRSILYSNANLHTVRDPAYVSEKKNKKVNARVISDNGEGLLETDDLGSVSEINKACLEAMRKFVLAGKGKDIRKNQTNEQRLELQKLMYHFMLKRAGDWCQALSLNDISREYTVTSSDDTEQAESITLSKLQADGAEIALVTHDRILLAYALYNGLNVYYSGKRLTKYGPGGKKENIAWLLYFKNMATITVTDYPTEITKVITNINKLLGEVDGGNIPSKIKTKLDSIKDTYNKKIIEYVNTIKYVGQSIPVIPPLNIEDDSSYQTYIKELRLNTYLMANLLPVPVSPTPEQLSVSGNTPQDQYKQWKAVEVYVLNLKNIEDNNSNESTPATWEAEYVDNTELGSLTTEKEKEKEKKKHIITNLPSLTDSAIYKISDNAFVLQATTDKAKSYGLLVSNIFPKIVEDLKIIKKNIGTIDPPVDLTSLIPTKNAKFGNLPTSGLERLKSAQNQVRFYADIINVLESGGIEIQPGQRVEVLVSTTSGGGFQSGGGTGDNKIKQIFMTRTMDTVPLTSIFYDFVDGAGNKIKGTSEEMDDEMVKSYLLRYEALHGLINGVTEYRDKKELIKTIYNSKKHMFFKDKMFQYIVSVLDKSINDKDTSTNRGKLIKNYIPENIDKNKDLYLYSHVDRGIRMIDSNQNAFTVVDDIVFDSNLEEDMKKILKNLIDQSTPPPFNYMDYNTQFFVYRTMIYYIDTIITRIQDFDGNKEDNNKTLKTLNKEINQIMEIRSETGTGTASASASASASGTATTGTKSELLEKTGEGKFKLKQNAKIAFQNFYKSLDPSYDYEIKISTDDGNETISIDELYRKAQVQKLRFIFQYYVVLYNKDISFHKNYYLKDPVDDFIFTYFYYSCRNLKDVIAIEEGIKSGILSPYDDPYDISKPDKKILTENIKPVKLIYQVLEGKEGKDDTDADNNSLAQAIRFASSNAAANEAVYRLLKLYPIPGVIEGRNDPYDKENKETIQRYRRFIGQPPESISQLSPTDISNEKQIEVTANAIRILQVMERIYHRKQEKLQTILGTEGILLSYINNFKEINRTNTENTNKVKAEEEFCNGVDGGATVTHVIKHLIDHEREIEQPDENPELKEEKRNIYEEYDHYIRNFVDIIKQFNNTSNEYYDSEPPETAPQLPSIDDKYIAYDKAYKLLLGEISRIEQIHKGANKDIPVHECDFTAGEGNKERYCRFKNAYISSRNNVINEIISYTSKPEVTILLNKDITKSTKHTTHKEALDRIINVIKLNSQGYCRLYWYLKNIYVELEDLPSTTEDQKFETLFTVDSCTTIPPPPVVDASASASASRSGGFRKGKTRKQRKTHKGVKTRTAKPRKQSPRRHKKHPKKTRKH